MNGLKNGDWKYYHENETNSAHGKYVDGKSFGQWSYYYENGSLSSQGLEREGQKEGFWKLYYENGSLKGDGDFESGSGKYSEYYPNGKLKLQGYLKEGKNHGIWRYYYQDGSLEGSATFVDGKGEYAGYYDNGVMKMQGPIEDQKKVGKWKLYNKRGELTGYYNPIYRDADPTYSVSDPQIADAGPGDYQKPAYTYKNRKIKYFTRRVNEYRAVVVATNPVSTIGGSLPFALEYYYQERLGYELIFTVIRNPFFITDANVTQDELYKRGYSLSLRQKFYEKDGRYGMFYFGHELYFSSLQHFVNKVDSTAGNRKDTYRAEEEKVEYGFFIGDRIMREVGKGGFTLDAYLGLGVGYRTFAEDFNNLPEISNIFGDLDQSRFSTSFRFGLNIGFMGPLRKSY